MGKVFIARQKIFDVMGKVFAYELFFRDNATGIDVMPTNIKATSHVIMNTVTNVSTDELLGRDGIGFINVDEKVLISDTLDVLDKKRFILEILETTELTEKVISKIKQYHARGFKIVIDDFNCSGEMIRKFSPLFKYIYIIKIDVLNANAEALENFVSKVKKTKVKLLAEKIETKEAYSQYFRMGFDLFQGYYLEKPEVVEIDSKESAQLIILQLAKIIKQDGETAKIESYIKKQPDLSFKLLRFLDNQKIAKEKIESLTQAITLLGRDKLLRWLMVYLYSEISTNPASKSILNMSVKRAERMQADAFSADKDKAYLAGMFSLLEAMFETDINDLMKELNMDNEINSLVINKRGKFAASLVKAETSEREYLKELMNANFDKISTIDLIYALDFAGVEIELDKL